MQEIENIAAVEANTEWYKKWFTHDYLALYSHRNLAEADKFLQFLIDNGWLNLQGKILDVACGAGRHIASLLSRRADIYGIDLSYELVKIAVKKIPPFRGCRIGLADMRHLPFKSETFSSALNLFTSFGYFENEANISTIAEIHRILEPQGHFILDLFNKRREIADLKPITFRRIGSMLVEERRLYNNLTCRIEKTIILHKGEQIEEFFESVKCYELEELTDILIDAGFVIKSIYGDYSGKEFSGKSARMIIIGMKT